jgi:hypothetical protein
MARRTPDRADGVPPGEQLVGDISSLIMFRHVRVLLAVRLTRGHPLRLADFWGFPHWFGIVFFFIVMRSIFIPFRPGHWYGGGFGPYAPHYGWVAMWNGFAWFALMIFCIWVAYHFIPEFHDFVRSLQAGYDYRYGR